MPVQVKEMTVQSAADPAATGIDCFLSVKAKRAGKIKGEGTTDGHQDDIECLGFDWGVSSATALGSTQATARRQYTPLIVYKGIDSASIGLASALATNDEIKEAVLTLRKAGGSALDFYSITLTGARITDISVGSVSNGLPVERLLIAYTSIDVQYKKQQSTGGSAGSFSFHDDVLPE
jgi:type VI secretion system secreted protein Hcp